MAHYTYVLPVNPMWTEHFSYPPLRQPMAYSHSVDYYKPMYNQKKEHMSNGMVKVSMPLSLQAKIPMELHAKMPMELHAKMPMEHFVHPMVPMAMLPAELADSYSYRTIPLHIHD